MKMTKITKQLTQMNCIKLALYAAELAYQDYKKYDKNDTTVIAAINSIKNYLKNPCEKTVDTPHAAANAAECAATLANDDARKASKTKVACAYDAFIAAKIASFAASNTRHAYVDCYAARAAYIANFSINKTAVKKTIDYGLKLIEEQES